MHGTFKKEKDAQRRVVNCDTELWDAGEKT